MKASDDRVGTGDEISLAATARHWDRAAGGGLGELASKALAGALVLTAMVLFGVFTAGGMAALHAYRATSATTTVTTTTATTTAH